MSRNFIPAVLAIGMGVFTGYYTFQPALKDLEHEKNFSKDDLKPRQQEQSTEKKEAPAPMPSDLVNYSNNSGK
ncbi:uncharacterized protein EURHEDRAFT_375575 [Aspergillus ruber CBS 135680]|uniref:Uncharacterized protein n=1 Tax=Aspergillus ruber (strain CBS 135680) TaxID=1388766 RepID=A0A017SNA1_ASPRC|nr:uncharacterized protein EURHEDRAFT_375575 [Aspergillus ruber CBS 135680]EYE97755.1 hypothetical protein EURHEDRAFT_375575 [Aspergillus ruber CBS 135680]